MKPGDLIKFSWGFGGSITATGILISIKSLHEDRSWALGNVYIKHVITILTNEGRQETYDLWSTDNEPEVLSER